MNWENKLRQLSVGQRMAIIIALLLLPMAALSIASLAVLEEQEGAFRESVEESVHTLLPLTTLEHYLQRALVDELQAQSNESVPNFAALTHSIDQSFAAIDYPAHGADLQRREIDSAHQAWMLARPSVQRLVEQVRSLQPQKDQAADAMARNELQLAINDISQARQQLAAAVETRYVKAIAARRTQLGWLIASWVITLSIAALLITFFLQSLLRPIKSLAKVARSLGAGEIGVRAPIIGQDELTLLAERFNDMAAYWEATRKSLLTEVAQDPLTGTLNRRGILAALENALAEHARQQSPVSLLMIDLNRFKVINDRYGHAAGDRALIWVAAQIRNLLRAGDRLGRYGGDEFLALLPGTDAEQAQQIAQRMSRAIAEAAARETAYPAISVGVATAPADSWDPTALIHAADMALYQNKERQRSGPSSLETRLA
jgi:diguanylate cyclase (GGDEF)-like protein